MADRVSVALLCERAVAEGQVLDCGALQGALDLCWGARLGARDDLILGRRLDLLHDDGDLDDLCRVDLGGDHGRRYAVDIYGVG